MLPKTRMHMHMHMHTAHAHCTCTLHMHTVLCIHNFTLSDVVSDLVSAASWEAAAEGVRSVDGMGAASESLG